MRNSQTILGAFLVTAFACSASATTVTLDVDFESPFTVGAVAGQAGWGESGTITTAQAHSGTQSLQTALVVNLNFGTALKALDATGGEYPFAISNFSFGNSRTWNSVAR